MAQSFGQTGTSFGGLKSFSDRRSFGAGYNRVDDHANSRFSNNSKGKKGNRLTDLQILG